MGGCGGGGDEIQVSGFYTHKKGDTYSEELDIRDDGTYVLTISDNINDDEELRICDQWSGKWEIKKDYLEITVTAEKLLTRRSTDVGGGPLKPLLESTQPQYRKDAMLEKFVGTHTLKIESNGDLIFMAGPTEPYKTEDQTRLTKN